jgi:hypothetical protein
VPNLVTNNNNKKKAREKERNRPDKPEQTTTAMNQQKKKKGQMVWSARHSNSSTPWHLVIKKLMRAHGEHRPRWYMLFCELSNLLVVLLGFKPRCLHFKFKETYHIVSFPLVILVSCRACFADLLTLEPAWSIMPLNEIYARCQT